VEITLTKATLVHSLEPETMATKLPVRELLVLVQGMDRNLAELQFSTA
jgi:hypothetical protein